MFKSVQIIPLAMVLALVASAADARTRLQDDKVIEDGLRIVAIGKMLDENCEAIAPRRFKALGFALSLQRRAKSMGYTDAEIDAYLESDSDKDRIKGLARSYLKERGVNFSDPTSYCAVGRTEIQEQTSVGQFLRAD